MTLSHWVRFAFVPSFGMKEHPRANCFDTVRPMTREFHKIVSTVALVVVDFIVKVCVHAGACVACVLNAVCLMCVCGLVFCSCLCFLCVFVLVSVCF